MQRAVIAVALSVVVALLSANVNALAHAQGDLVAPTNVAAQNTGTAGKVRISWDAVPNAAYYRIGWVAYSDVAPIIASGGDWLEHFAFIDIENRGQTEHLITRLTPGVVYAFIMASNDGRYGTPRWPSSAGWAFLTLNEAPATHASLGSTAVNLTWDAVPGAAYYRIGWVVYEDVAPIIARGGDWLEHFAFIDIANRGHTEHAIGRLTPGLQYAFIVAGNDGRYGTPQWPPATAWQFQTPAAPPAPGAAPVAPPTATPQPGSGVMEERPRGILNVGQRKLGPFMGHPSLAGNPQIFALQTAPIGESLLTVSRDRTTAPMLAKSWEVSADGTTWTFRLEEGVQFHKGYGEMTAEDVIWSMRQFGAQGSKHPRASNIRSIWESRTGHAIAIDDYTVEVNTGEPWSEVPVNEILTSPSWVGTWIVSKKQSDKVGVAIANGQIAATGSWDLVDYRTGEFWRMEAIEGHWRKTPHFAEMIFWELPEESSRIAGFQTGYFDTTQIAFDSRRLIEAVEGAEIMAVPVGEQALNFYGQYYVGIGTENQQPGYDPDLPWVSSNPDINSQEWRNAAKVRTALSIAIDRQWLVDGFLHGYGTPAVLWDFGQYEDTWLPPEMRWEFNPERARQLLAEAGYPDGFSITLSPAIRGAPVEVEACEAIATMWGDIGLDVNFRSLPYNTLRPSLIARNYQGSTCQAGGIRLEPGQGFTGMLSQLNHQAVWNRGVEHPWLDEKVSQHMAEVNTERRRALAIEIATFLFENAITGIGLYNFDNLWPVGPNIQPWSEGVRYRDLRNINGYEYIRHR